MDNIILFEKPAGVQRLCSFCKKTEHQLKRLISNDMPGDAARNICDDCVEKATKLIKDSK